MKDKSVRIDWDKVEEEARRAYLLDSAALSGFDFERGYLAGYKAAFEEYR